MKFELPPLPYSQDALDPVITKRTLEFHHGKHHAAYVTKLEAALPDADKGKSLEDIIVESYKAENAGVFNNAAQVWNHTFYWHSMTPDPMSVTDDRLAGLIKSSFDGEDGLKKALGDAAVGQFGSGWAWLLYDPAKDSLLVKGTANAENPLPGTLVPLLTIDVWEHAYYLDYQHERAKYVNGVLEKLINWEFAASNLPKA